MGRPIKKGSADQSTVIRIIDSTNGTPETAVEHDTGGIDLWFRREKETKTSITEVALAALDSSHSDGGIEHIGDGYYRLDLPDAAIAAGSGENSVQIGGTVTGMIVIGNEHALVDYDPYDTVRLGLTALPNAAVDASGGLPISDAGGLDLDAMNAIINWQRSCSGTVVVNNPGTDTIFDLTAVIGTLSTEDDIYNNMQLTIYDLSGSVKATRKVNDFDGGNGRFTVDRDIGFPVDDGVDTFILWNKYSPTAAAGGGATAQQVHEYDVSGITTPGQAGYEIQQGGSHLT